MLRCNKYCTQGDNMNFESIMERLQKMFSKREKNEVEQYIESKNPKTAADVEYWLQQYTYQTVKNF
jgi:hypothetical protein